MALVVLAETKDRLLMHLVKSWTQGDVSDRQWRFKSQEAQAAAVVAMAMEFGVLWFGGLLCYTR